MAGKHTSSRDWIDPQLDLLPVTSSDADIQSQTVSSEARDFLAIAAKGGVGRSSLAALLDSFRPLGSLWEAEPARIASILHRAGNRNAISLAPKLLRDRHSLLALAEERLASLQKARISLIFRDDSQYPQRLRTAKGPPFLFVQGNASLLSRASMVGVVGTRTPTTEGLRLANRAACILTDAGFVVTSGLAEGIDSEAHQTVAHRGGQTIAVLGNGLGIDFPASNRELRREILVTGGAVLSEFLLHESYSKSSFVQRNHTIAAICGALVPIEGKTTGGTSHTVRFARELSRLLIGLTTNELGMRKEPDSIITALVDTGAPLINLDDPDGPRQFLESLTSISFDACPPLLLRNRADLLRRVYSQALRQLAAIVRHRQPEADEQEWLLEALTRVIQNSPEE